MNILSYKQLECVLLENNSISVRYLFFGSHLNMIFFLVYSCKIKFYAKTHLLSKCYGNDFVLTINGEKNVYNNETKMFLLRSTDERASCLSL